MPEPIEKLIKSASEDLSLGAIPSADRLRALRESFEASDRTPEIEAKMRELIERSHQVMMKHGAEHRTTDLAELRSVVGPLPLVPPPAPPAPEYVRKAETAASQDRLRSPWLTHTTLAVLGIAAASTALYVVRHPIVTLKRGAKSLLGLALIAGLGVGAWFGIPWAAEKLGVLRKELAASSKKSAEEAKKAEAEKKEKESKEKEGKAKIEGVRKEEIEKFREAAEKAIPVGENLFDREIRLRPDLTVRVVPVGARENAVLVINGERWRLVPTGAAALQFWRISNITRRPDGRYQVSAQSEARLLGITDHTHTSTFTEIFDMIDTVSRTPGGLYTMPPHADPVISRLGGFNLRRE
jgi:rRNA maturation endonuclease Nob1